MPIWGASSLSPGGIIQLRGDGSLEGVAAMSLSGKPAEAQLHRVQYNFELPNQPPNQQWLEADTLPIGHTCWESNNIRYTQIVFQTRLGPGDLMPSGKRPSDAVLVVRLVGECRTNEYTEASAAFKARVDDEALELELKEDLIYARDKPALLALAEIPAGATTTVLGPRLRFSGSMPPGTSGSMTIKIPLGSLAQEGAIQQLRILDFEDELRRVKQYWKENAQLASADHSLPILLNPNRTALEWRFDRDNDLQGWAPNADLRDVAVTNGWLACQAVGSDPILELRPLIDLPASPWQVLEVELWADRDGMAEFFWSNTTQTQYGGFSQDKSTRFAVVGDDQWRTYRLLPGWHRERKIIRLRFDLYDGARFKIKAIRVQDLPTPVLSAKADFDFTKGAQGWQPFDAAARWDEENGFIITNATPDSLVLSPPCQLNADDMNFLSLDMSVNQGTHAALHFVTDQTPGWHSYSFPMVADRQRHLYNVDLLASAEWRGHILGLGLRPSDAQQATARLHKLTVSDEPQGPPQLILKSFALEDSPPRAGRPASLTAILANMGGQTATNVRTGLVLPPGVRILNDQPPVVIKSLAFSETTSLTWKLKCDQALSGAAELYVTANNANGLSALVPMVFTAMAPLAKSDYVPEPHPVRGKYEVGAYYFPGWKTASQWQPIQSFPERRPVLGWYREGDPEVADWQIKWAVEHGITFFAYDWYWSQGARQLEHALYDGFFKARYRHLLKFCLLWANHNAPRTSSREDSMAVTRYWIEQYFRRPEYLMIEGQPVVIIFSAQRLTEDLGSEKVRDTFAAMREECRKAGLSGLYLMACVGEAGQAQQAAREGYDAVTAYNWPSLGITTDEKYAPYETLLAGYRRQWNHLLEQAPIPLCLPLNGGWDSRPWHGDNNLVRFGRTPALFQQHLLDAKHLLESPPRKAKLLNMVLVEAWNEWGEGSYIEPHQEFGFGYLDAIRNVFTEAPEAHTDVTPIDIGLGPYDIPRNDVRATHWEFEHDDEGWANVMDLTEVRAQDGVLQGRTTGNDPAFFGPPMQARANEYSAVVFRLKLQRNNHQNFSDTAQLFWRTSQLPESEATSLRCAVIGDGQWHEYRIPVASNHRWRNLITRLRLDPCNQAGVLVELDYLRLVK